MMSKRVGIYIHIPFCHRKCLYCDFCSFEGTDESARATYVDALCREIDSYRSRLADYEADTVYFGGGTPSCLSAVQTARILDTVRRTVPLTADAEITSEVNPATADAEKLRAWYEMGINRLSVGVQSFCDTELKALGRLHSAKEAEAFIQMAREIGFENISLDLMYGIPGQTLRSFGESLAHAVALHPTHISAYSLKLEPGTPFDRMRATLTLPDEDTEVAMYETCIASLTDAGYNHYEISNYAHPGYESRHNLKYWRMEEYIGFGVSAYSYFGGERYGCDRNLTSYAERTYPALPVVSETCDPEEETIMLGLRLREGISEDSFRAVFGYGFWEKYGSALTPYVSHGLVLHEGNITRLTDRGMYVSLGILAEILE